MSLADKVIEPGYNKGFFSYNAMEFFSANWTSYESNICMLCRANSRFMNHWKAWKWSFAFSASSGFLSFEFEFESDIEFEVEVVFGSKSKTQLPVRLVFNPCCRLQFIARCGLHCLLVRPVQLNLCLTGSNTFLSFFNFVWDMPLQMKTHRKCVRLLVKDGELDKPNYQPNC